MAADFHQIAQEHVNKEVEVITLNGNFNGRLHEVGKDVIFLHSRGRTGALRLVIRIETIVAMHRVEFIQRGPFGFSPSEESFDQEPTESR
jgi:hypothetical protein